MQPFISVVSNGPWKKFLRKTRFPVLSGVLVGELARERFIQLSTLCFPESDPLPLGVVLLSSLPNAAQS
jgi:hypothetical protein